MRNVIRYSFLTAGLLMASAACVTYASTVTQQSQGDSTATLDQEPDSSVTTYFSAFAGSTTNAQNLVNGLRTGSSITLSEGGQSTVFTPPTSEMGNGEVAISLGLAQQQLASYGITNPTPEEIQAALVGGTIMTGNGTQTLTGVLTMRNSGMGWGEIAQKDGFKLGSIVRQIHAHDQAVTDIDSANGQVEDSDASGDQAENAHASGSIDVSAQAHADVADPDPNIHKPDIDVERPQVERPDIQRPDIQRPDVPEVDH